MKPPHRTTTLGYALLGLLHQQPRSGYDLRKIFDTTAMVHFSGSPGAIYPALRKLEQAGLIRGSVDRRTSLRPRQVFRPTPAGTRALHVWLSRPVHRDDVIRRMDELMLRFAFHSLLDDEGATASLLRGFVREIDDYIPDLRAQLAALPATTPTTARLALESGLDLYRARSRWARRALAHFGA